MNIYEYKANVLSSIKKKHLKEFGWIGLGKTFKTPLGNGYYIDNLYPPYDLKGLEQKRDNLTQVIKFYYFLRKNIEKLYANGIDIKVSDRIKYNIEPYEIYISPDILSGHIFFLYGKYHDTTPYNQMTAIIDRAKEELEKTTNQIEKLKKPINIDSKNLILY